MKLGAWLGLMVVLGGLVFAEEDVAKREAELLQQVKAENAKSVETIEATGVRSRGPGRLPGRHRHVGASQEAAWAA